MKNKKERIELSYNPQITADHDSGIIVANGVTQDCTDHAQLEPQVNSTMENVGELPEGAKMCFDNAYSSGANLRYLEANGLDGYEGERRRMTAKMRSETGKEAYKKRKEAVEWPFGNIKQNLKVIWGKLERNVPVIGTIRVLVANSVSKVGNFLRLHPIVSFKCQC